MFKHEFVLHSGTWIGEGKITFSASNEHVRYFTKWIIQERQAGKIVGQQDVQMQATTEATSNYYIFTEFTETAFQLELSNELLGTIEGKGIMDVATIAWEFRGHPNFEGFEVYELQDNGDYMVHAEYISAEQFRTIIDGRIWKKST